jgi:hypothetical protein
VHIRASRPDDFGQTLGTLKSSNKSFRRDAENGNRDGRAPRTIHFDGAQFHRDIAAKAMKVLF